MIAALVLVAVVVVLFCGIYWLSRGIKRDDSKTANDEYLNHADEHLD